MRYLDRDLALSLVQFGVLQVARRARVVGGDRRRRLVAAAGCSNGRRQREAAKTGMRAHVLPQRATHRQEAHELGTRSPARPPAPRGRGRAPRGHG
jgi:hypothetical protein